ncbi:leucine-rich repeat domain-containing protein [Blastopirellula marina]|uniref:Leucine Rich repeats (2 copies) n=1 Tax=Blastopirellula marina TaxID=124 RepID=A0A2S8GKL7_9BACT|nr:hypothetical protein [Blastopirellula marina]PQO44987.1 hypothetical protein C5Y93_15750 [Blastopirellula marina]
MKSLPAAIVLLLAVSLLGGAGIAAAADEPEGAPTHRSFHQIDLQSQGNQKLSTDFHGYEGNNLKPLPRGLQTMADVEFEIGDKMIQLASKRAPDFPEKVSGIQVGQKADRLHFFHGTGWGSPGLDDGLPIGSYVVRYADETEETIPIEYGRDVRDWWTLGESDPATRAKVAWSGVNDASKDFRGRKVDIRLFLRTWENPHPNKKIATVDFVSRNETISAPFLVALTAETVVDDADVIEKLKQHGAFIELGDNEKVRLVSLSGPGQKAGFLRGVDDNLRLVCELPSVEVVYANFSDITDDGLQSLQKLPRLRWLSLNLTEVSDQGLAHLANLEGLERLRLHGTKISDVGLGHLSKLKNLEVLDLSNTETTDGGLVALKALTSLKDLDLRGTRVTEEGVGKLRESLGDEVEIRQ